jgi:hypothetical protein
MHGADYAHSRLVKSLATHQKYPHNLKQLECSAQSQVTGGSMSTPTASIETPPQSPVRAPSDQITRLKKLYELSMTLSGEPLEIFGHVARMIGELLDVKVVCLSEIRGANLEFLSVYVNGEIHTNAGRCSLQITPRSTVESSKDIRIYDRVMERFPQAKFLKGHSAFSYCKFPALDNNGKAGAVTCLVDDRPHEFSEEDQEMLRIFGQRIGMELDRQNHINAKEAAHKRWGA